MQDDLNYVAFAMAIARAAFKVTWRAIAIAVGLSLVLLLVLATGKVQPIEATFIRIGIEVMVLGFIYFQRAPNAPR